MAQSSPLGSPIPGTCLGTRCSVGAAGREGVNHPVSWDGLFPSCLGLEEEQLWQRAASSQNNSASHGNYRAAPPARCFPSSCCRLGRAGQGAGGAGGPGENHPPSVSLPPPLVSPLDKKNWVSMASPRSGTWLLCLALPCSRGVKAHKPHRLRSHLDVAMLGAPNTLPHSRMGKA